MPHSADVSKLVPGQFFGDLVNGCSLWKQRESKNGWMGVKTLRGANVLRNRPSNSERYIPPWCLQTPITVWLALYIGSVHS